MKFKDYDAFLAYIENVEKLGVQKFVDTPAKITLEKTQHGWKFNGILIKSSLEETFFMLRKFWMTEYSFFQQYEDYLAWKNEQQDKLFQIDNTLVKCSKILSKRNWGHAHIARKCQWLYTQLLSKKMDLGDAVTHCETCK